VSSGQTGDSARCFDLPATAFAADNESTIAANAAARITGGQAPALLLHLT